MSARDRKVRQLSPRASRKSIIEAALTGFEKEMFARSQAEAVDAHEIQEVCLGDRAPYSLIEFLGGDSRASR